MFQILDKLGIEDIESLIRDESQYFLVILVILLI